jgi:hypothetical protein
MRLHARLNFVAIGIGTFLLLSLLACQPSISSVSQPTQNKEQKQQATEAQEQSPSKLTEDRVRVLVETESKGLFQVDTQTISPSYLIGDFNGDGIDDIAVPVKLSHELDSNNKAKTPFWFDKAGACTGQLPEGVYTSPPTFTMSDLARYRGWPILLVIHGTRESGWNNTQPQQQFVIVDAWDQGKKIMSLYRGKLKPVPNGDNPQIVTPPHFGDALLMLIEGGKGTAILWDGEGYCWYPVNEVPK